MQHFRRWLDGVSARVCRPAFIALTESIRQFHHDVLRYPDTQWAVIPNPLDLSRLAVTDTDRYTLRVELGLQPDTIFVLAVGNLLPVKGHRYLIEAVARLPEDSRVPVFVGIAGEGPEREALEALIRQNGLASRVRLLGYREDIGRLLAASDIYAMPSLSEGQSIAVLEAMHMARPMLLTTQGAHTDFLQHGVSAMLAAPGSATELETQLRMLVQSEPLRLQLGRAATACLATMPIAESIPMQLAFHAAVRAQFRQSCDLAHTTPTVGNGT